jgi:hypothetical protein
MIAVSTVTIAATVSPFIQEPPMIDGIAPSDGNVGAGAAVPDVSGTVPVICPNRLFAPAFAPAVEFKALVNWAANPVPLRRKIVKITSASNAVDKVFSLGIYPSAPIRNSATNQNTKLLGPIKSPCNKVNKFPCVLRIAAINRTAPAMKNVKLINRSPSNIAVALP